MTSGQPLDQPSPTSQCNQILYFIQFVKEQTDTTGWSKDQNQIDELDFILLTTTARQQSVVEVNGIEPMTPCLQSRCSPN